MISGGKYFEYRLYTVITEELDLIGKIENGNLQTDWLLHTFSLVLQILHWKMIISVTFPAFIIWMIIELFMKRKILIFQALISV